jgi:hypothetical protein
MLMLRQLNQPAAAQGESKVLWRAVDVTTRPGQGKILTEHQLALRVAMARSASSH